VRRNAATLGLSPADLDDVVVSSETRSEASGVTSVYLSQRFRGIEIIGANLTVNISRDGSVLNLAGEFVARIAAGVNATRPTLRAPDALDRAAGYADVTLTPDERRALHPRLVFHQVPAGRLRLGWLVEIETRDAQHVWVVTVDAVSGALLDKHDRVVSQQEDV
jgi:extracellular elastinolytic metalloproteinase